MCRCCSGFRGGIQVGDALDDRSAAMSIWRRRSPTRRLPGSARLAGAQPVRLRRAPRGRTSTSPRITSRWASGRTTGSTCSICAKDWRSCTISTGSVRTANLAAEQPERSPGCGSGWSRGPSESPAVRPGRALTRKRHAWTRRAWLKEVSAAGAGSVLAGVSLTRERVSAQTASSPLPVQPDGAIIVKTSTSDVFIPPRGRGFQNSASTSRSRQLPSTATTSGSSFTSREYVQPVEGAADRAHRRSGARAHLHGTDLGGRAAAVAWPRHGAAFEA